MIEVNMLGKLTVEVEKLYKALAELASTVERMAPKLEALVNAQNKDQDDYSEEAVHD